jgi:hypothetical protein
MPYAFCLLPVGEDRVFDAQIRLNVIIVVANLDIPHQPVVEQISKRPVHDYLHSPILGRMTQE